MAKSLSVPYILIKALILKERWSIRNLASKTGINKNTVQKHVREMGNQGLVIVKTGRNGGIWWIATALQK